MERPTPSLLRWPNSGPPVDIAYQPRFELSGVPENDHLGRACIPSSTSALTGVPVVADVQVKTSIDGSWLAAVGGAGYRRLATW